MHPLVCNAVERAKRTLQEGSKADWLGRLRGRVVGFNEEPTGSTSGIVYPVKLRVERVKHPQDKDLIGTTVCLKDSELTLLD